MLRCIEIYERTRIDVVYRSYIFPAHLSKFAKKFEWKFVSVSMSTTLPLFWDLSSADKKQRLDASVKLISTLENFQASFERKSPEEDTSSSNSEEDPFELDSMLDSLNAPDVVYSIRRLVRGLASPRESSRLGFAVALTEVWNN